MKSRINLEVAPGAYKAMLGLEQYLHGCGLELPLIHLTNGHAPDSVYEKVRPFFSEKELADLPLAVATINAWNRLAISARTVPGNYQPAKMSAD